MTDIQEYEAPSGFLVPLDMKNVLVYEKMAQEVVSINNLNAPFYMQEFMKASDIASSYWTKAMFDYETSKTNSKAVRGRIMLDIAPLALQQKGLKPTVDNVEAYTESHPEYVQAKELEAYNKALETYMENKFEKFTRLHDDARAVYNGTRDYKGQSSAAPSGSDVA